MPRYNAMLAVLRNTLYMYWYPILFDPESRLNGFGYTDMAAFLSGDQKSIRSMISMGFNWIRWTGTFA